MAAGTNSLVRTMLTGTVGLMDAGAATLAERGVWPALGGRPDPADMSRSPRFVDGAFRNVSQARWIPRPDDARATLREFLRDTATRRPPGQLPLIPVDRSEPADGLHLTWFGHSSTLVRLDGARVLIDPVWGERVSPMPGVGPRRLHPVPHRLSDLPELDVVVISHDHYDHLDMPTVRALAASRRVPFVVPLGVGAHLRRWNIPEERITELDWGESTEVAGLQITACPAQHFSGRALVRNNTLWASWAIAGPTHKVFYSGDSGYFDGFRQIGEQYGPFDVSLIQMGAYNSSWPDIHMTPEEGVATHRDVRGGLLVPVHWATFNLAPHPWGEPVDRAWSEAKAYSVDLVVPKLGERIRVDSGAKVDNWWQSIPTG